MNYAWTLFFSDVDIDTTGSQPRRFWSGEGDLVFTEPGEMTANTWLGTKRGDAYLISVGEIEYRLGAPEKRLTLSFALVTLELEQFFLEDLGPIGTEFGFLHSEDGGRTWLRPPGGILKGRLSNGVINENNVYTCEIESYLGDTDREPADVWSRENFVLEYGKNVVGFERVPFNQVVNWPPR